MYPCSRFIKGVNGFVGEGTVGNISFGEAHACFNSFVGVVYAVMFCGLVVDNLCKFRDYFSFVQVFSFFSCMLGGFLGGIFCGAWWCGDFLLSLQKISATGALWRRAEVLLVDYTLII